MANITTCPLCGHQISRKELDSIEARIRREERERAQAAEARALAQLKRQHEESLTTQRERLRAQFQTQITGLEARLRQRDLRDQHREDEAVRRARQEFTRERSTLHQKIKELERRVEAKTANERGDDGESDLVAVLRDRFPGDALERIGKGATGGDVRQVVRDRSHACGTILYEVKNQRTWQRSFLRKLKEDATREDATHAVLASVSFPARQQDLCIADGVIVAHPRLVPYVAHVLRESMLALHRQGLSQQARADKLGRLYEYLGSGAFARHVKRAAGAVEEISQLDQSERDGHERTWKRRGNLLKQLDRTIEELDGEVSGIVIEMPKPAPIRLVERTRSA